jgi:predicted PurR-regulated permease PerM
MKTHNVLRYCNAIVKILLMQACLVLTIWLIPLHAYGVTVDSNSSISKLTTKVEDVGKSIEKVNKSVDTLKANTIKKDLKKTMKYSASGLDLLISLLPVLSTFIVLLGLNYYFRRNKMGLKNFFVVKDEGIINALTNLSNTHSYNIAEAATDVATAQSNVNTSTIVNPIAAVQLTQAANQINNTANQLTDINASGPQSSSRLIAFISGLISVVLAACITSYSLYYTLKFGVAPGNLWDLVKLLLAMGIGVIPYSVNQLTSNAGK